MKKFLLAAVAAASVAVASAPAHAELADCDDVTWIIPFSESGGSAKWSLFWAPLVSEQLGMPVNVEFMPGAGSTKGANFFQNEVDADSCTIFGSSGSTQFPYLLGDDRVEYEYKDWQVVLATPTGGVAYTTPDMVDKLASTPLSYGAQRATSLDLIPLLAMDLMGYDVTPTFGLKGRGNGFSGFQAGEYNVDYQTSSSYLSKVAPLVEAGEAVALFSWGSVDADGNLQRDPTFPDIPHFSEVLAEANPAALETEAYAAWKAFMIAGFAAQKMVFLPNDSSAADVAMLTEAFKAATMVEGFDELSAARLGKYTQGTGTAAQILLESAINVDEAALEWARGWITTSFGVEL